MRILLAVIVIGLISCTNPKNKAQCDYAKARISHTLVMDSLYWDLVQKDTSLSESEKVRYYPRTDWNTLNLYLQLSCK